PGWIDCDDAVDQLRCFFKFRNGKSFIFEFKEYVRYSIIKQTYARHRIVGEGNMAHIALYRTWRPQLFQDVVGQKHIIQTLQNSLKENRLSHAYLFSGPRGTGKTTAAKLLAK